MLSSLRISQIYVLDQDQALDFYVGKLDPATAEEVRSLLTKGRTGGHLFFTTPDARKAYDDLLAKGVEFTQEPTEQPYGIDFGLRDPFGNHIRVAQMARAAS